MKLNSIDFNKIAVFCQIIESGTYQRASEVLHVTPSALSQTVSSLERSLGIMLFERRGRNLVPTKDGMQIHLQFRKHQSGFIQALQSMKALQSEVSGTLRVGAYLEFAKSKMTVLLKDFIREFPDANIKMVFDSPSRLQSLLDAGQLDLCLSIFPSAEKKAVRSKVLCQEELVMISAPHEISDDPSFGEVMSRPIIDYYYNHQPIGRWLSLHFGKRPKKVPVRIFAATAEMVTSLVREGAGIGVVPLYLVESADSQRGLKVIRPTSKRLKDYIWILERVGSEKSPLHTMFRAKLLQYFDQGGSGVNS